jgi:hypothetical protein
MYLLLELSDPCYAQLFVYCYKLSTAAAAPVTQASNISAQQHSTAAVVYRTCPTASQNMQRFPMLACRMFASHYSSAVPCCCCRAVIYACHSNRISNRAQKVKLVDAGFIWTEPHSKRLKVKLTIQDEVMNGTILQQGFVVEFVVENHMCLECNRANANPNSWTACVQVRLCSSNQQARRLSRNVVNLWRQQPELCTGMYVACASGATCTAGVCPRWLPRCGSDGHVCLCRMLLNRRGSHTSARSRTCSSSSCACKIAYV